jgi:hypothetical protein
MYLVICPIVHRFLICLTSVKNIAKLLSTLTPTHEGPEKCSDSFGDVFNAPKDFVQSSSTVFDHLFSFLQGGPPTTFKVQKYSI